MSPHGGEHYCELIDIELSKKAEEYNKRVNEINTALYTLIEAQKNTTKNVDTLTTDVKELTKTITNYEAISKRVEDLESSRTWVYRLVIGTLITAAIAIILKTSLLP